MSNQWGCLWPEYLRHVVMVGQGLRHLAMVLVVLVPVVVVVRSRVHLSLMQPLLVGHRLCSLVEPVQPRLVVCRRQVVHVLWDRLLLALFHLVDVLLFVSFLDVVEHCAICIGLEGSCVLDPCGSIASDMPGMSIQLLPLMDICNLWGV